MSRLWHQGGRRIRDGGRLVRCDDCPCGCELPEFVFVTLPSFAPNCVDSPNPSQIFADNPSDFAGTYPVKSTTGATLTSIPGGKRSWFPGPGCSGASDVVADVPLRRGIEIFCVCDQDGVRLLRLKYAISDGSSISEHRFETWRSFEFSEDQLDLAPLLPASIPNQLAQGVSLAMQAVSTIDVSLTAPTP